jgi:hypothetical protein
MCGRENRATSINKTQAIELIRRSGLSDQADLLIEHLLPSARIVVHDGPAEKAMASYYGGLPTLPSGTPWPTWDKYDLRLAEVTRLENDSKQIPKRLGYVTLLPRCVRNCRKALNLWPFWAK